MKIKKFLGLFIKYLHSIPVDVPLYTEEMFLKHENNRGKLKGKNRKLHLESKK